eukprot:TRINITY_DN16864_c0_g7_i1.p1 TRINITY_DN16864_c0_g7~~TRINITY_DN16864_c0_g7_i1.p1  ORF type:complete len:392 (-),score=116.59 TRINITY_DN16864_c0_g7_i1:74-1249(-)
MTTTFALFLCIVALLLVVAVLLVFKAQRRHGHPQVCPATFMEEGRAAARRPLAQASLQLTSAALLPTARVVAVLTPPPTPPAAGSPDIDAAEEEAVAGSQGACPPNMGVGHASPQLTAAVPPAVRVAAVLPPQPTPPAPPAAGSPASAEEAVVAGSQGAAPPNMGVGHASPHLTSAVLPPVPTPPAAVPSSSTDPAEEAAVAGSQGVAAFLDRAALNADESEAAAADNVTADAVTLDDPCADTTKVEDAAEQHIEQEADDAAKVEDDAAEQDVEQEAHGRDREKDDDALSTASSESSDTGMDKYGFPKDRANLGPPPEWRCPRPRRVGYRADIGLQEVCERNGWPCARPSASTQPVRTRPGARVMIVPAAEVIPEKEEVQAAKEEGSELED